MKRVGPSGVPLKKPQYAAIGVRMNMGAHVLTPFRSSFVQRTRGSGSGCVDRVAAQFRERRVPALSQHHSHSLHRSGHPPSHRTHSFIITPSCHVDDRTGEQEFKHKRIKGLQDEATADLLSRLEECIEFMEEAIQANTGVLVHWYK